MVSKNRGLERITLGLGLYNRVGKRDYRTSGLARISRGEGSRTCTTRKVIVLQDLGGLRGKMKIKTKKIIKRGNLRSSTARSVEVPRNPELK